MARSVCGIVALWHCGVSRIALRGQNLRERYCARVLTSSVYKKLLLGTVRHGSNLVIYSPGVGCVLRGCVAVPMSGRVLLCTSIPHVLVHN